MIIEIRKPENSLKIVVIMKYFALDLKNKLTSCLQTQYKGELPPDIEIELEFSSLKLISYRITFTLEGEK